MTGCASNCGDQRFRLPPTFSLLWTLDPKFKFRVSNFFFSFPSFRDTRKKNTAKRRYFFISKLDTDNTNLFHLFHTMIQCNIPPWSWMAHRIHMFLCNCLRHQMWLRYYACMCLLMNLMSNLWGNHMSFYITRLDNNMSQQYILHQIPPQFHICTQALMSHLLPRNALYA